MTTSNQLLSLYIEHCDCDGQKSSFTCILWALKCEASPLSFFAINLVVVFFM
jgi:hypothetical protein